MYCYEHLEWLYLNSKNLESTRNFYDFYIMTLTFPDYTEQIEAEEDKNKLVNMQHMYEICGLMHNRSKPDSTILPKKFKNPLNAIDRKLRELSDT